MRNLWMRWSWSVRLRDVIVLSLLPLLVAVYLVAAAISDYNDMHQFDDPWSRPITLDTFFFERASAALKLPKMWALQRQLDPEKDDPGLLRLSMQPELWSSWKGDPLAFFGQWNNATLIRGNSWSPVRMRKRGDNSVHWITEKKSFTMQTRGSTLFKGYSRLGFSAKSVLHSYAVARLASEFDLLAPFSTVAPVFVNEKFYGIFRVGELIDESFLRHNGRLPGNIFRGDTAERGEVYKGLPRGLAVNPYIWDRVAKDHQSSTHADATLQAFLGDLNGTTFDDHLRLMAWVDVDEIARLFALMLVAGDPMHMSSIHNNYWYQDPSSGLLHPIPWDIRLLIVKGLQTRPYRLSEVLREFIRNPFVLDRTLHVIQGKVAEDRLLQSAERIVRSISERYKEHFEYDRLREPLTPFVGEPDDVLQVLRSNVRLLNEWFNDSVVAFHADTRTANAIILDFEARGYTGSDLNAIALDGDIRTAQSIRLVADRNLNGILDASDQELAVKWTANESGGRLILTNPLPLLPGIDTEKPGVKPAPIHYRFFLTSSNRDGRPSRVASIRAELRNRLTGRAPKIIDWKAAEPVRATPSWHPWQYPAPQRAVTHRLSGDARLRKTLVIPKNETLVIDAGTTVQLDPDVSILSYGQVIIRGTSASPVTFVPAVKGQPWGTFALQGEGANGSILEHARFNGGGGAFAGRIEYKGMVSVHWATQVAFRYCEFSDNVRSDDALNAVHSNLTIENSTFLRATSDAIDFDYSQGKIANNRFEASGNDAIDLMGSAPQIIGNHITGSGDKGISIGEGSSPFVFNNYIARSTKGIEIKDGSEPFIVHNMITQNTIGVLQSAKNWRYGGGGWGKLLNSAVADNGTDIKSDNDSRLTNMVISTDAGAPMAVSATVRPRAPRDSAWILAQYGIKAPSNAPGKIDGWTSIKPIAPKVSIRFEDDFESIADGWVASGAVSRLQKRDKDLQVTLAKSQGHIARNVDWDLTDPRYTYIAVFELAGRNVRSAAVSVDDTKSEATSSFQLTGGLSSYSFVTVDLKPARYHRIKIVADPGGNTGRLHLHSYSLYAIPKTDLPL